MSGQVAVATARPTRSAILDKASELLSEEGVHALSMRRLSKSVGASTMVLYTQFADKQDILDELYVEGFRRLQQQLDAVPPGDDPVERVVELGRAYRRCAIENPTYYQIMFSDCVKGFSPSPESREHSTRCFEVLRSAVEHCERHGLITAGSPGSTAQVLWGTLHGVVSLELLGYWGQAGEARLEDSLAMLRAGLVPASDPIPRNTPR